MGSDDAIVSAIEGRQLKRQISKLEPVLDKKTLENEILAEAAKLTHNKADLAHVKLR